MRKLVFAVALSLAFAARGSVAADLPVRAAPPAFVPPPVFSWTGCYVGVAGGWTFGHSQHFQNDPAAAAGVAAAGGPAILGLPQTSGIDLSGGIAGGTAGCNYQYGPFVVGLEDDFSWTNKRGTAGLVPPFNVTETAQTRENWVGTFRGRVGAAWDRWFLYATGGGAFAEEAFQLCDPIAGCAGSSHNVVGWAAGAGVEYAIWQNFTVKLEYLHTDFGRTDFARAPNAVGFFAERKISLEDNIVRFGFNYKFDLFAPVAPPAVTARY